MQNIAYDIAGLGFIGVGIYLVGFRKDEIEGGALISIGSFYLGTKIPQQLMPSSNS